uniref:Uncharacterized protein n=1 Tax=Aegilops tauschii subsp. strangulata TaxID=200361 RepID=A0A453INW9_AEGTS
MTSRAMLRSCAGHGARTVASPRTATPPHRGRRQHLLRPRSSAKKSPQEAERGGGNANNGLAGALPSKTVLLRAGAVLFALGFVDAGYVSSHHVGRRAPIANKRSLVGLQVQRRLVPHRRHLQGHRGAAQARGLRRRASLPGPRTPDARRRRQ